MEKKLNAKHAEYLKKLSIPSFNTMQEEVIEKASTATNLLLLSPTGTGKTLAYLIVLLDQLRASEREVQALIVAPSRELSLQIEQVFKTMKTSFKVSCCYGGHDIKI
jgi:superfamily II DNA/RNA helicase